MVISQVWMLQRLSHGNALGWVEVQHFFQQINSLWVGMRVSFGEGYLAMRQTERGRTPPSVTAHPYPMAFSQGANVFQCTSASDERHVFLGWGSQDFNNNLQLKFKVAQVQQVKLRSTEQYLQLVAVVFPGEQRTTAEDFSQDAADTPHINGRVIGITGGQQLWRSVPPSDDIHRQLVRCTSGRGFGIDVLVAADVSCGPR